MQEKVYKRWIKDVNELCSSCILTAWDKLDQRVIDTAIVQCTRLRAHVKAKGGHSEHNPSQ